MLVKKHCVLHLGALLPSVLGLSIVARQSNDNTAIVDLSVNRGDPQHLASGVIYGIPQTAGQIPDSFFQNMGYNFGRSGGGQLSEGGWITGFSGYQARFASAQLDYQLARKFGGQFIILPHDLWGTDHANSSTQWPGDNDDWTDYDNFITQVLDDIASNDMIDGMSYDIWNEADGSFWARSQTQYLAMWNRVYQRIRTDSRFESMIITGPSSAGQPSTNNDWWVNFVSNMVSNNSIPDVYAWHDEPGDPNVDVPNLNTLLAQYNAPSKPININEYATFDQQVPASSAWFISRLERWNANGLRGNWLSNCQLYDFLGSLLTKSDTNDCSGTGYQMNGDYTVYQYYNQNMTGYRTQTTSSGDGQMDAYTTIDSGTVRTLVGVLNSQVGTWWLTINNLSSAGLPTSGDLPIHTWGFDDTGHFGASNGPSDRGTYTHSYSGDSVTFPIYMTDADRSTAFAFEFSA